MTPEEAKVFLSDMESHIESKTVLNHIRKEALQTAISALEKQIPKKPTLHEGWLYCSVCRKDILIEGYKFCPDCGQRIKWENEG